MTCSSRVGGMIFFVRSETERSMIRATAMTEARSRNQMGQPAAWMIANNAFPYRFFSCFARTVRQRVAPRQVSAMQQWLAAACRARATVVDIAISTKSCGQVCGLLRNGLSQATWKRGQVGCDQNLSRNFRYPNRALRKRIVLRGQFCRAGTALYPCCRLV